MKEFWKIGILLLACTSPLLTFTSLWQIKEWRVDRLREHLRASGWLRQLFGAVRPAVVLVGVISTQLEITLMALAVLSCVQIIARRQRYPVWTRKAVILITLSIVINALVGEWTMFNEQWSLVIGHWSFVIIPLLQPIVLLISWMLFLPIDRWMKNRIMKKAAQLRSTFTNATVIGITGSVGKTTTKELIAHILKDRNVLCTPAYVNSEMGVAQWLLKKLPQRNVEEEIVIVIEMGAYRTGEIAKLCSITKPDMGVLTFIGSQHIALFGSQEKLCQAKGELLEALPKDGTAFINNDCALCEDVKDRCVSAVQTVGTGGHADCEAYDIEEAGDGIRFRIDQQSFAINLHGTHNVTNVLLALSVAKKLGISLQEIAKNLQSFVPPHHTFSVREEHGITILDDTHNASPASFRACLAWAKSQPMQRKILVTPGLIELGTDEERIHRELGGASNGIIDRVVFTSKNGSQAFAEGFDGILEYWNTGISPIQDGDLLLCVGRVNNASIQLLLPH